MVEEPVPDLKSLMRLLQPYDALGVGKVRLGGQADGGYVVLDDFADIDTVIGCGVGWDVSFERAFADKNIPVHLYDHTVDRAPQAHANFSFHKRRLSAWPAADAETLESIAAAWPMRPFRALLKMDIEGDEWPIFAAASGSTLLVYRQIVCELHHLGQRTDSNWYRDVARALRNLSRHFVVVHVHGNNYGLTALVDGK